MSANEIANRLHFACLLDGATGALGPKRFGVREVRAGGFGPGTWEIVLEQPLYLVVDVNPPRLGANIQVTALSMPAPALIPFAIPFPPSSVLAPENANVVVGFADAQGQGFVGGGIWHVIGFRYPHF